MSETIGDRPRTLLGKRVKVHLVDDEAPLVYGTCLGLTGGVLVEWEEGRWVLYPWHRVAWVECDRG